MSLRSKIIFTLIIIQPIIDLITSIVTQYSEIPISIGALFKTLVMFLLIFYITHYFLAKNKYVAILYSGSYVTIFMTFFINMLLKDNFNLFAEINLALKTSYFLTMIFSSIALAERNVLTKKMIYRTAKIVSLIVGTSYWIALFTKTSFNSYNYGGAGFSGWFYSANELSVIVILLLGLVIINLNTDQSWTAWLAFILIFTMVPMIGTKTAFLGGGLLIFISIIFTLFKLRLNDQNRKNLLLYLGIIIIFTCFIPFTPIASKASDGSPLTQDLHTDKTVRGDRSFPIFKKILSSRDTYFWQTSEDYLKASGIRKAFGLGYSGDEKIQPKLIEMDFFDLFFSYGIVGSLFLSLALFYAMYQVLPFRLTPHSVLLFTTLSMVLAISFLAGHVIFAPAVMTNVAIASVALFKEKECGDQYGS